MLTGIATGFIAGNQQHVFARDTAGRLQHWWSYPNGTPSGSMNHDTWDATGDMAGRWHEFGSAIGHSYPTVDIRFGELR